MKVVLITPDHDLTMGDVPAPQPTPGRVLIRIKAAAINRADLLQREGKYPPPPGWPDWPGLECAGIVEDNGGSARWKQGDSVCALLGGGGYAEMVSVPENMVIPLPEGFSFTEAAALPEVFATAYLNLCRIAQLKAGETFFMQAGASGLGMAAIQLAKTLGAKVVTTVGSERKAELVRSLGADVVINRKTEPVDEILAKHGIDVALDCAGGEILGKCLPAMNPGGRWILVATLGGEYTQVPLRTMMTKHIRLIGSTLRSRSDQEKGEILAELVKSVWPLLASGKIRPIIDAVYPFAEVKEAQGLLQKQSNAGKVVMTM